MGQILVWECERTGELFREEKDYKSHARKLNRQLALEERARQQREREVAALQPMYQRRTFRALEHWIVQHFGLIRKFGREAFYSGRERRRGNLVAVHLYDMRFGEQSCSHTAPLGKPTNWGRKDHLPTHYMGWKGSIELIFDYDEDRDTDALRQVGICTGSGGGGGFKTKKYPRGFKSRYEVILWADDFPKLVPTPKELLDGGQSGFGNRTTKSVAHDIFNFDRLSLDNRVELFSKMQNDVDDVVRNNRTVTAYTPFWDNDAKVREVNLAAKAFAKDYQYFVRGHMYDPLANASLNRQHREGKLHFLGRFDRLPLLTNEVEQFVGWKLDGSLDGTSEIIDLRARLAKLTAG